MRRIGSLLNQQALVFALAPGFASAAQDLSSCNANALKHFIGKPAKEMQRVRTEKVRYVCEGCPVTMDFSSERLPVVYSEKAGIVKSMGCN